MSLNRHSVRRDANEPEIIQTLLRVGAHVEVLDQPVDLCAGWGGRWVWIEIKDPAKPPSARRLTDRQEKFFARCHALGLPAAVALTPEDALQAIGAIR